MCDPEWVPDCNPTTGNGGMDLTSVIDGSSRDKNAMTTPTARCNSLASDVTGEFEMSHMEDTVEMTSFNENADIINNNSGNNIETADITNANSGDNIETADSSKLDSESNSHVEDNVFTEDSQHIEGILKAFPNGDVKNARSNKNSHNNNKNHNRQLQLLENGIPTDLVRDHYQKSRFDSVISDNESITSDTVSKNYGNHVGEGLDDVENRRHAIVSFVIDEEEENHQEHRKEGQRKQDLRIALTSLLSLMYGATLILLGFVFPLTEVLRNEWLSSTNVSIFNVYIYSISSIFLVYININLWMFEDEQVTLSDHRDSDDTREAPAPSRGSSYRSQDGGLVLRVRKHATSGTSSPGSNISLSGEEEDDSQEKKSAEEDEENVRTHKRRHHSGDSFTSDRETPRSTITPLTDEIYEEVMVLQQTASLGHDGASFYLRLGALGFAIANFIYVVLQIEYYMVEMEDCSNPPDVYPLFFHLIFLVIQTFFLFKNTKIHVKRHKTLARFGFMHLLATNMCNWLRILVLEVAEGVHQGQEEAHPTNDSGTHALTAFKYAIGGGATENSSSCLFMDGLYQTMAPYLFPFVLEYSLIAAAALAGMYRTLNLRVTQDILQSIKRAIKRRKSSPELSIPLGYGDSEQFFAKSHRGLYLGAMLLAGVFISVIMFHFTHSDESYDEDMSYQIYFISDITIHVLMLPPIVYAAVILSKFKFTYNRDNTIDDALLLTSLGGLVLFYTFTMMRAIASLVYTYDFSGNTSRYITIMSLVAAIANIVQGVIQGIFVVAGLQLCAANKVQQIQKPARGAITFLIISNLALWVFKTFQVKEIVLDSNYSFYGPTAWPIIMNTNLPLVLFYRFHTSVCLADMWASVYKSEFGPKYKTLR